MQEKLKVGIVGTGHGVRTIAPAFTSTGKFDVIAVSGSSISRTQEAMSNNFPNAVAVSFDKILIMPEIDLLCVASPNEFHAEHMIAAANTGFHLYLEKPIGNSAKDAAAIESSLIKRPLDLLTVVGHQLRFNPFLREIRDHWQNGALGKVYSVVIRQRGGAFASAERPWTWEFEKERGGGVRLAMGTHLVDLVNFLSNSSPLSVFASMDPVHMHRRPNGDTTERTVDVCNFFSASLDYGTFEAYVTTSAASHGPNMFEVEILGSEGSIFYDGGTVIKLFLGGSENNSFMSKLDILSYNNRPGSSIFRKSLGALADEIYKSLRGEDNCLGDASSVKEGVQLLKLLDDAMEEFNSRRYNSKDMF